MKSTCIICQKEIEYTPIDSFDGLNLSDLRPTICSDQCHSRFREEDAKKTAQNVFYAILRVLPDVYKGVKMSDFDEMTLKSNYSQRVYQGATDIIKNYCNSKYWCIALMNESTGIGKSRLALYILACLALKGNYNTTEVFNLQDAGYWSALDIAKILKTESYDAKQYNLKRFYRSRVLIIDDLGQESKYESSDIAGILKVREENNRKTIITSNLNNNQLIERYTKRIESRIMRGALIVQGKDWRNN